MTLVVDNRATVTGPGIHALIAGVSDYAFLSDGPGDPPRDFGFRKLGSPALSAFRFFQWLTAPPNHTTLAAPVKTVRLLLSPSALEIATEPHLAPVVTTVQRPTRRHMFAAARDWQRDASAEPRDVTLFYFGGHGMRITGDDTKMLFDDFGDPSEPVGVNCSSIAQLRLAMAASQMHPNIATTQFYFIDCCRNLPEQIDALESFRDTNLLQVHKSIDERGVSPTYFATTNGNMAIARRGRETVFCEALLHALKHAAIAGEDEGGAEVWPVTALTLQTGIARYLLRRYKGDAPQVNLAGTVGNPRLHYFSGPPLVDIDLRFRSAALTGSAAIAIVDVNTTDPAAVEPAEALAAADFTRDIPVGVYKVVVKGPGGRFGSKVTPVNQDLTMPWPITQPENIA